jgi:DNA-binding ferritin-like protein
MDFVKLKKEEILNLKKEGQDTSVTKMLNQYLCLLRSAYIIHQNSHWKCAGTNFYGNHLLFQRLYESAADRTDPMAEKIIGLFGNDSLDISSHPANISKICLQFDSNNPFENSLGIEQAICEFLDSLYKSIKESSSMTYGLDDLLMSQRNEAEVSLYLLKQAMG